MLGTFDELERPEEHANERRTNVDEERIAKRVEAVKIACAANREKRAAREAKLPFVAGVWEQNDDSDRELCVWSRHATEKAAKAAARRYARRMRSEGPAAGGALSWSGGWRGPTGGVNWIEFAGCVDAR